MNIRLLKKKDINSVSKIVGKNYSKKWGLISKSELYAMFSHKALNPRYFVIEEDNKIIAFAGYCTSWIDYEIRELFWINVLPKFQGKGVGTFLIKGIINYIKKEKTGFKVKLIILSCKSKLVSFYQKFGFKKILKFTKENVLMGLIIK